MGGLEKSKVVTLRCWLLLRSSSMYMLKAKEGKLLLLVWNWLSSVDTFILSGSLINSKCISDE